MTPIEAAAQAVREARERFQYEPEPAGKDDWKPSRRFATDTRGDCDDFAGWAIERAHELCPGEYRFVVGRARITRRVGEVQVTDRYGHAWCAVIVDSREYWFDATPGWPRGVYPAEEWDHVAEHGWRYAGDGMFTDRYVYGEGA